jgi:hypothetical protein
MKLLPILLLVSTSAIANPVINEYSGYKTAPDCYGSGCLPTTLLRQVIENPNSYNQSERNAQRQIELLEESNSIARQQLELEKEAVEGAGTEE